MEDLLIRKIKGGINAIKGGRKSPQEAGVGVSLNRLKAINEPMYDELMAQYKRAVETYNNDKHDLPF
jgi:hypothetical protein